METNKDFFLRKADAYKMLAEAITEAHIIIERLDMMIADLIMAQNDDEFKQYAERYTEDFLHSGFKHLRLY